ncbi:hypothetical protein [Fluviicola taffensis]|uniref:hypothetical protein n=1 Tax=Fluviicola taffensis TaxID=191579 RepID=UPI0005B62D0D|nr:hypothetical protein [Fluviicola taffensis]
MSAKVIADKIHITGFRILHAEMNSPFDFDTNAIKLFDNTTKFDLAFNLEENLIKSDFFIEIKTESKENTNLEEATAKFHFAYIFNVENFKELTVVVDDTNLDINGGLANSLASIVYSTTRGILMTRFQGTALADFILPVRDPNELIN